MTQDRRAMYGTDAAMLAEVARFLRHARSNLADMAERPHEALRLADIQARSRDLAWIQAEADRLGVENLTYWGPTISAIHLGYWLVERADCASRADSLAVATEAAVEASEHERPHNPLALDLAAFVRGHLDGTISDEKFTWLQEHPLAPIPAPRAVG